MKKIGYLPRSRSLTLPAFFNFAVGLSLLLAVTWDVTHNNLWAQGIVSTFDNDVDGWTVSNTTVSQMASGGNPGGFLFHDNPETTISILMAPAKFLGDLRAFNGGTFSFDGNMLQQSDPPFEAFFDYGHAEINGLPGESAVVDMALEQPPEKSWKTFNVAMTAAKWIDGGQLTEEQWQTLLSHVSSFVLSIEAINGQEMQGIDNIKLLPPAPTDDFLRLVNISTRAPVGTGDNVMIGGIIVRGSTRSTKTNSAQLAGEKKVLLRAIGPSLPLAGTLADPKLALFDSTGTMIGANDNWRTTQIGGVITSDNVAAIEASTIPPTEESESAMVVDLPEGAYTVILSGVNDTTGIALVEAYDLDGPTTSDLANISTRSFVQTGDDVMIGGIIISSDAGTGTTVVLRAIGPSLAGLGVAGTLEDPMLELHDSTGALIASNDDWKETQQTEIEDAGLAPNDDRESAIQIALGPGLYTAIVRGAGDTSGVALVEAYNLEASGPVVARRTLAAD